MTGPFRANHRFRKAPADSVAERTSNVGDAIAWAIPAGARSLRNGMTRVLIGIVRFYQITLSPYLGGQCRFHPSCSNYALDALAHHGPLGGSWLALKRLLKCHPFHPGGFDPAPPQKRG